MSKYEPCKEPNVDGSKLCDAALGHPGTGHSMVDDKGVLHTWYGTRKHRMNDVVTATVAKHAAEARWELARTVAALAGLPALSVSGRVLRLKRDRLAREVDAWTILESYCKGDLT